MWYLLFPQNPNWTFSPLHKIHFATSALCHCDYDEIKWFVAKQNKKTNKRNKNSKVNVTHEIFNRLRLFAITIDTRLSKISTMKFLCKSEFGSLKRLSADDVIPFKCIIVSSFDVMRCNIWCRVFPFASIELLCLILILFSTLYLSACKNIELFFLLCWNFVLVLY